MDYDYSSIDQRVSRGWSDDYSTDYYWNGWGVVNEYFSDDQEEQYGWAKTYVGGLAERAYSGGAYAYYFTDHLGSTEAAYNEAKSRTAGIEYTAWGEILSTDGAAGGITRRYTGHDYDPLTGDYFAPYRFYSPGSHRWLTRDPMGMVDGPNVYAYVGGNPVLRYDPLGLHWWDPFHWFHDDDHDDPDPLPDPMPDPTDLPLPAGGGAGGVVGPLVTLAEGAPALAQGIAHCNDRVNELDAALDPDGDWENFDGAATHTVLG